MQTQTYQRKPLIVEAVQVTDENLYDVAKWCGGEVRTNGRTKKKYIRVDVINPQDVEQTRAVPGKWILKSDQGYKIWANGAFIKGFELEVEENHVGQEATFASSLREGLSIYGAGTPVHDVFLSHGKLPADMEQS